MISKDEVKKIAKLARIEVTDKEASNFGSEIDSILEYVGQISSIAENSQDKAMTAQSFNIMREDKDPHRSGIYTKDILFSSPDREGDYIKVKKIL